MGFPFVLTQVGSIPVSRTFVVVFQILLCCGADLSKDQGSSRPGVEGVQVQFQVRG